MDFCRLILNQQGQLIHQHHHALRHHHHCRGNNDCEGADDDGTHDKGAPRTGTEAADPPAPSS